MTAQSQRDEFVKQYKRQFKKTIEENGDWGDLFWELSKQTTSGSVLIVLDEITWMAYDDRVLPMAMCEHH